MRELENETSNLATSRKTNARKLVMAEKVREVEAHPPKRRATGAPSAPTSVR